MSARVTILLPALNAAATLPACLRSVARQRLDRFRCVVVDDGSIDDTAAVVRAFARRDARFELLHTAREGLVAALHRGLAACDGELVARMDADDLMHRDRLAMQVAALDRDPTLDLVGCHARPFPSGSFGVGTRQYVDWLRRIRTPDDVAENAFVESPILHPTWCARRAVLCDHPYAAGAFPEDYELLLRLLQHGHRLAVVPRTLHAWRRGPTTATVTDPRYALANFAPLKARYLAAGMLAGHRRYVLWGYGSTGRAMRKALAAHDRLPAAIVELHPGRLGNRIHAAPVIPPAELDRHRALPVVVSVAGAGPRAQVRAFLTARGWTEGAGFVCTA